MKLTSFDFKQAVVPDYQRAPNSSIAWLGLASILAFALVFWLSRDLGRICEVTAVCLLVLSAWQVWQQDRREWLWLLMLGWLVFMAGVNMEAMLTYPLFEGDHLRYSRYYLRLFLFLVAGWWLGGNQVTVHIFLGLGALGLFMDILVNSQAKEWMGLFSGHRVDFAFRNAQHTAILFSIIFLGTLCFWKRFWDIKTRWLQPGAVFVWLAMVIVSFLIITGTQTRQVVPAFFLCLCATGVWGMRRAKGFRPQFRRFLLPCAIVGIAILVVVFVVDPFQGLQQRFAGERETILQVLQGDFNDIPPLESTGQRIYLWQLAAQKILESPLTGHGAATRYKLIQDSDIPEYIKDRYHHFHNGYLEMGVAFGLPGLCMLPVMLSVLGVRLIRARQKNVVPEDFMLFGLLSLIFFATVNLFESYVMYRSGYFFMCIIGGAIYTMTRPWTWSDQGNAIKE